MKRYVLTEWTTACFRRWCGGLIAILLSSAMTGCDRGNRERQTAPPPPVVSVSRPIVREVTDWDLYPGRLAAAETVEVRARVSGFIEEAPFDEGSIINRGDILFIIDPRPYQAELNQAQAQVAQAEAQRRFAASEFERIQALRASNAASEDEYFRARQALESAEATLAAARAAVESAELNLGWTRVTAPIGGRVGRKLVTIGNLIASGAQQATLLTTITAMEPIYCYIAVDERTVRRYQDMVRQGVLPSVRKGRLTAQLALGTEGEFTHEGYIDFVDNRVNPETGTLDARGVFANPDGRLLPGFFARLRVPASGLHRVVLVPEQAIGTSLAQQYVLVVGPDNIVQQQPVTAGNVYDGLRAVEGLSPDTRVVVKGLVQARPGFPVQPHEISIASATAPATNSNASSGLVTQSGMGQGPSRSSDGAAAQDVGPGTGAGVAGQAGHGAAGGRAR